MSISTPVAYKLIIQKEAHMFTQPTTQLVQWQDFKLKREADIVFEIAQQKGWSDCEIFGSGDMITQPLDSMGWKLVPADLYEYSIPAEGVDRVLQVINAGIRIKGVIIADDERGTAPPPTPPRQHISLPSAATVVTWIGTALLGLIMVAGIIALLAGAVVLAPFLLLGALLNRGPYYDLDYDPKLIILVDGGNGDTVWISLLTWYE